MRVTNIIKFVFLLFSAIMCTIVLLWLWKGNGMYHIRSLMGGDRVAPSSTLGQSKREKAVWVWDSPETIDPARRANMLMFAELHNVTDLYLNVEQYVVIHETEDAESQQAQRQVFIAAIEVFVKDANARDIRVHALAGNRYWSLPSHRYLARLVFEFVNAYNVSHTDSPFAGIQFDIEYYEREEYKSARASQQEKENRQFLDTVDELVRLRDADRTEFSVGLTVPYWFDNSNGRILPFEWNGETREMIFHLLDRLARVPNAYVVLMDYRRATSGPSGAIAHARDEFDYARNHSLPVGIVVGQLVSPSKELSSTFYGTNAVRFQSALEKIDRAFGSYPQYRGAAIHEMTYYRELMERL